MTLLAADSVLRQDPPAKRERSQCFGELFCGNISLPENAGKRAELKLGMKRNHTALCATPHDDVTAVLTQLRTSVPSVVRIEFFGSMPLKV